MGYSKYKNLNQLTKKFALNALSTALFRQIDPVAPSPWLLQSLEYAYINPPTNEKAKSERLVSPVLVEVSRHFSEHIALFSGEEINANPDNDLNGPCDFFFALHPPKPYLDTPIISLAEAKNEDLAWGIAQCAAQIYGAHLFNLSEQKNIPTLYGCATTGSDWQFMKFENNIFYIEPKPVTDLPLVLGIWHTIIKTYLV